MTGAQRSTGRRVGRPSLGITKKVSMTLSGEMWAWLESQATGNQSNMFRGLLDSGYRKAMIEEIIREFPAVKIVILQGKTEFSERMLVPKGIIEEFNKYVLDQQFNVVEKGSWLQDDSYLVMDIYTDQPNHLDDHILWLEVE